MKTTSFLMGLGLIATFCSSAIGQGTVNFANLTSTGLNVPVFLSDGATKVTQPYVAQLRGGPDATTMPYVGSAVLFLSGSGAGYFNGGAVTIPSVMGGGVAQVQVVVWDPTLGGTTTGASADQAYAYAIAGHANVWGASAVFPVVTGNPNSVPPGSPGVLSNLTSIVVGCLDCNAYFAGFTSQPTNQTVNAGASVTFTAGANAMPPPAYQWYFNGTPLTGATLSSYQIAATQSTNAGNYWVVLSSTWGVHTSDIAVLTVLVAPSISSGPSSRTAEAGTSVALELSAIGSPAPVYQWFFNNSALPGATDSVLRLSNVQAANSGLYMVTVTNALGATTSDPAALNVVSPVVRQRLPGVVLQGQVGNTVEVQSLEALGNGAWQFLSTLSVTSSPQVYVDFSPTAGQRFYRTKQSSGASGLSLELDMVPNLTLTGPLNHLLAVEGINAVGPTDAWFTIEVVNFTNTGQTYPDVSSIHQPPRVWRIVPWP